jgi:hypothetical protein
MLEPTCGEVVWRLSKNVFKICLAQGLGSIPCQKSKKYVCACVHVFVCVCVCVCVCVYVYMNNPELLNSGTI